MRVIKQIEIEEQRVLAAINTCLQTIRKLAAADVTSISEGIIRLARLRSAAYEELNQLQHEALLLRCIRWLAPRLTAQGPVDWWWNPRQTGGKDEPDLQGRREGVIVVSVEATASELPRGVIDRRMKIVLKKLSGMEGERYYAVCTREMERRASTKIARAGYRIRAQVLPATDEVGEPCGE